MYVCMYHDNKMENEYIVKCDECKKRFKENVTFKESVEGGKCDDCRIKILERSGLNMELFK